MTNFFYPLVENPYSDEILLLKFLNQSNKFQVELKILKNTLLKNLIQNFR